MNPTHAVSTDTPQQLIDPQLAAYEILRRIACRRAPFNAARPRPDDNPPHLNIPQDLEGEIETAALAYQLSTYLFTIEGRFGRVLSEKVRSHVILLSAFDSNLESQVPRFLEVMTKAAHACALRSASEPSDDIMTRLFSILAAFTLIEIGYGDEERQKTLHTAVGAHLGAAYLVAKAIFASELEATNGASTEFQWSAQPGPFERQLQRQQGNPLYPVRARSISANQVSAARLEDLKHSADFLASYNPLVRQAGSLPSHWPLKEGSDFWKKVIDLIEPGKTLGGYFSEEVDALEKIGEAVENELGRTMKGLNEPDFPDNLKTYRSLSFVGGLLGRMTIAIPPPASNEEVLRAVLSEDSETISAFGRLCGTGAVGPGDHLQTTQTIIQSAVHDGMDGDVAIRKLEAFRHGFESAKPKQSSNIWQSLKKVFR